MVKVLRKLGFLFCGRLLKRLKRPCWKRGRRVTACVGSNPMSSVEKKNYFLDATNVVSFFVSLF